MRIPTLRKRSGKNSKLLNPLPREADISDLVNVTPQLTFDYLANTDEAPTRNEVVEALKKLQEFISGVDGIINEQLK